MLELVKKNIHMNRWKGNATSQITLDDDFIVPDTMDDVDQVILQSGEIIIESVKNQGERILIRGKMEFNVLYRKAEGGLQTLGGSIVFEEPVNVPGLEEKDYVQLGWDLEDLNAGTINSRKLSIKAIVTLEVKVETLYDVEAAVEINTGEGASSGFPAGGGVTLTGGFGMEGAGTKGTGMSGKETGGAGTSGIQTSGSQTGGTGMGGGQTNGAQTSGVGTGGTQTDDAGMNGVATRGSIGFGNAGFGNMGGGFAGAGSGGGFSGAPQVEVLRRSVAVAAIAMRRKDTYRIKENLQLSGNKPNIDHILWSEMKLRGMTTRPLDGKVALDGQLMVFAIYQGEGEEGPVQWLEESIPFNGELEISEALEGMVPSVSVHLIHREIEAKPDYDGELRELEVDAVLELDMKLYREENIELLSDLYSTNRELTLEMGEACFDKVLTRNMSKCKLGEKMDVDHGDRILQICHGEGAVKLDATEVKEDGLYVEGVLEVSLLYLTADDAQPIQSSVEMIPFHYLIEAPGIDEKTICQLVPGLDQMSAVMMGGGAMEVKATIALDLLALQPVCEPVIKNVSEAPMDLKKLQEMPGIVGYIVQPGDSLWKIAKKFHTTVDTIMAANGLTDSLIKPGDRLLLVKEMS